MLAIAINDRRQLDLVRIEKPALGPTDLLVKVRYAAVNAADLKRASSHLSHSHGGAVERVDVAGLEMSGIVEEVGPEVVGFNVGDRIMGMTSGTYAQFCTIDYRHAIQLPGSMSFEQGAASCIGYMTAHDALVTNGQLRAGEAVLIQAASSAVGFAAVQLAKLLGAKTIFGTSTDPTRYDTLLRAGATEIFDPRSQDVAQEILTRTDGRGVDIVIDMVGGAALPTNLRAIALLGRIVCVGRLSGALGELNIDDLARKRVTVIGVTFRTRTVEEHAQVVLKMIADLRGSFESGVLRPVIDSVFDLAQADEAQGYMRSGKHFGKILLRTGD